MTARALTAALVAALTVFAPAIAAAQSSGDTPAPGSGQAQVRSQHGDWQKVCKRPTGAPRDICALVQDVTSESNPNVGLSVHLQSTVTGEKVLRVFAPLGILLPPGLGLQIDEDKVGHAPFVRCHAVGCYAQVTLTPDLLARFRAGQTAWFIVFQSKEAGIGIPISLEGLPTALSALDEASVTQ